MVALFDPNTPQGGDSKGNQMTPEELKKLQEMYELKRQMDAAAQAAPPAPEPVAERAPAPPAPVPTGATEHQQVRDPNAERFGVGVQIMGRVQPNEDLEARRWQEAEEEYGKSIRHARIFRGVALARMEGAQKHDDVARVVSDIMGDLGTARYIEGLYTREASSQSPKDGGFFVPMETSGEIIRMARPYTVLPDLGVRVITVKSGSLSLDKQSSGSTAKYGFENKAVYLSDVPEWGQTTWNTKRLDTSIVFSKELMRRASFDIDALFRDDLGKGFAAKIEHTFVNGAGSNGEIVGIEKHPDLTDVVIGAKLDEKNLYKFKQKLRKTYMPLMGNARWLFNEDHEYALQTYENSTSGIHTFQAEMDKGMLKMRPYHVSQNIPTGGGSGKPSSVYFGDFSEWWIVREGAIEIDASDKVPYEDANGDVKSAWSRHQVAIKMVDYHDMAPRDGRLILRCKDAKTE